MHVRDDKKLVEIWLNGSKWVCTGLSYVASLTLDDASEIDGDVYQNGEKVELKAGTYGNVIVVPAGEKLDVAVTAAVEAA